MRNFQFSSNLVALGLLAFIFIPVAKADTLPRTWVSGAGSDVNPCTRTAPCATFARAIMNTDAGGEIDCVDAGDFGPVVINKALTIDCGGNLGYMLVPASANGIIVNAGSTDTVTLRSLSVYNTTQSGATGITYAGAKALHLENIRVSGFSNCVFAGTASTALLTVDNATLSDCNIGISANTSAGTVVVNINNTRITNMGAFGVDADNGSRVTIRDSTIYFNNTGVIQTGTTTLGSTVTVVNTTLGYSTNALRSQSGEFILTFGNIFVNDVLALNPNGGMIFSGADNINSGSVQGTANGGSVPKF